MATKPLPPDVPRKRKGSLPGEHRGGRTAGTPNKRTVAREALLKVPTTKLTKRKARESGKQTSIDNGQTPLEFLTSIYRSKATGKKRIPLSYQIDAAKAAAPFVHAKKIAVVSKNTNFNANVDAKDLATGSIDASQVYRDIMGAGDDEAED